MTETSANDYWGIRHRKSGKIDRDCLCRTEAGADKWLRLRYPTSYGKWDVLRVRLEAVCEMRS